MTAADGGTRWGMPLWRATAPARPASEPLRGEHAVDLAVVGGGFLGLSTALHAAQGGQRVAVLEAKTLAWGASGRNAGFVVPNFAKMDPDDILARLGAERGERLVQLAGCSGDAVFRLVRQHGIDCDAHQSGWIQPAHAAIALPRVEARVKQWAARARPVRLLDRAEVTQLTGCSCFAGGWIDASGGVIHPLKYAYGLADTARARGAAIHENSRVVSIERIGQEWMVRTTGGRLLADRVVLATNAYGGRRWPLLARSYIPLTVHQVATRPLPIDVRKRLLRGGQSVSDTRRNLFTFRFDAENRLISGGMDVIGLGAERRVPRAIHRRLARLLELPDLPPLEFAWSGRAAVMPDFLPHLFELGPGFVAAIGCNGRGIAITTVLGEVLADWASGTRAEDLALPFGPPVPVPAHAIVRFAPNALLPVGMLQDFREVLQDHNPS